MNSLVYLCFTVTNAFTYIKCDIIDNNENDNLTPNDIAEALVNIFGADLETSRITELKEKLKKVDSYVVDKNKYMELLKNLTTETDLNETNFYAALYERDNYKFLVDNETKSLYLKLKQNMNRDDVLNILAERGNTNKLVKSARKAIGVDYVSRFDKDEGDLKLDTIVDEFIAESPKDDHKFDNKDNNSIYWDPQGELEDLKEYHNHDGRRIFKGERTTIKNYPFMVSVHVMGRFWCGGSLYWHDLVLTSAACLQLMHNNRFFRENPKVLQVRIGSNHSRIGGEMVEALEVYFHPSYNPRTLRNNIAIIRLRYHLYFNYHRTPKIISISHSPDSVPHTAEVLLLGWGVKSKFISSTMFCAGTMTTGEGACAHDAGGPAINAGKLVGIISFGPTVCGFPNAPTVFTLVGAYVDWIETVKENMPNYYVGNKRTTTVEPDSALHQFDLSRFENQKNIFNIGGIDLPHMTKTTSAATASHEMNLSTPVTPGLRNDKYKLVDYTFGDDTSFE